MNAIRIGLTTAALALLTSGCVVNPVTGQTRTRD